jgi:predicted TIM-barrel fold metal-dependent hydrolase
MADSSGQDLKELPLIISVDDHVLEPPDLWTSRLPADVADRAPRVVRETGRIVGGVRGSIWTPTPASEGGVPADVWHYEDARRPLRTPFTGEIEKSADQTTNRPVTFDDVRPGAWQQAARLADMAKNHTDVAVCFPNVVPRFCGQTFYEGKDKELALQCVRAYNDWIIEDWTSGEGYGRLIPVTIIPLWDVELAAKEVRRSAAAGSFAVTFSESPDQLGLPSLYSGYWDPFFQACEETGTTVCMHIGSSSTVATTGPDAPLAASFALTFQFGMYSLIDMLISGVMVRFPTLKLMYSEANVGWIPYVLGRLDTAYHEFSSDYSGIDSPEPPSYYFKNRVYGCIVDDEVGLAMREFIGMKQLCFETDFPHNASSFPNSIETAERLIRRAGLTDEEAYDFLRGNAIDALGLQRFGVTK